MRFDYTAAPVTSVPRFGVDPNPTGRDIKVFRMRPPIRALPTVLASLALLAVACQAGRTIERGAITGESAKFLAAMDGLCQTQAFAEQSQYALARQTFQDQSHQYLHDVAARVQQEDAGAAGTLLEAKQQVEVGLADPGFYGPEEVVRRVVALQDALSRAGAVLGVMEAGCGA
jgi:hypothetical protein